MLFDPSQIQRAKKLIISTDSGYVLRTSFEGLGAEISNRCRALKLMNKNSLNQNWKNSTRFQTLSDSFGYASKRLTDILIRLQEIIWKRASLTYDVQPNTFTPPIDPIVFKYSNFLGLSIKDFHVDIISFMDSLAPVIIQAESSLKSKDRQNTPGWPDIQKNSKRGYRTQMSGDFCAIIDKCERWLPLVKKIRHLLTHRNHEKIVFGTPKEGLLFQVYNQEMQAGIVWPEVLYDSGNNVVDFELYSAFILSELFVLIDDLGNLIAQKVGIANDNLAQMCIREVGKSVANSIERLNQLSGT